MHVGVEEDDGEEVEEEEEEEEEGEEETGGMYVPAGHFWQCFWSSTLISPSRQATQEVAPACSTPVTPKSSMEWM